MTVSRTARILFAILLLAAAAFFWVNFFTQRELVADDPVVPPTPPVAVVPPDDADAVDAEAPAPDAEGAAAPPVVVVDPPVAVTRSVVVAELPFLVTAPPAVDPEDDVDPLAAAEAERQLAAARASVNPFSPIVVRTPAPATAAAPPRDVPPTTQVVTEVPVPAQPGVTAVNGVATAPRIAAPAPAPLAPPGSTAADLPRALPTGTPLSPTPELLREPRTVAERVDVTDVAVIRVPEPDEGPPADITPGAPLLAEAPVPEDTMPLTDVGAARPLPTEAPLAAGTNPLARYLRDNAYSFTGSVLGPVGVGVFRSSLDATPQVVAIGQTLPDTDIVLTDLRGQQAELTLDDTTQILVLDLRR
jgi:hypothetical protein